MTKEEKFISWLRPIRADDRWVKLSIEEAAEIREYLYGLISAGAATQ